MANVVERTDLHAHSKGISRKITHLEFVTSQSFLKWKVVLSRVEIKRLPPAIGGMSVPSNTSSNSLPTGQLAHSI